MCQICAVGELACILHVFWRDLTGGPGFVVELWVARPWHLFKGGAFGSTLLRWSRNPRGSAPFPGADANLENQVKIPALQGTKDGAPPTSKAGPPVRLLFSPCPLSSFTGRSTGCASANRI